MPLRSITNKDEPASASDDRRQALSVTVTKAPAGVEDMARVTAPDYSDNVAFECQWMPRGVLAPDVGDEGIMIIDENGQPWLVGWEPAAGSTPPSVTGSRGGNAAVTDLLTKLDDQGIITDNTTP